jgi:arylsulfatase A-like enzyme
LPYNPPEPYASMYDPEFRGLVECTAEGLRPYKVSRPPANVRKNVVGLYDGNLAYADAELGRVVETLQKDGRWDDTIFIFTSDHGEAFWQHNWRGHGSKVFEEFVRVPLVLRIPGLPGQRIADVVELVDIFPTLLDLFALEPVDGLAGQSWLPRLTGGAPADSLGQLAFFRNHESRMTSAIREGAYKVVRKSSRPDALELFDLRADPREEINLQSHRDPVKKEQTALLSGRLGERLANILANGVDSPLGESGPDSLSAEAIERLKALGYFN